MSTIEQTVERKLKQYDYGWAVQASERLDDELARIRHYYEPLIQSALEEHKPAITEQFDKRQAEIRWQFEPRVTASAVNCGIFHLSGID
ncbi:Bacterial protein YqhG [compost metagenome]